MTAQNITYKDYELATAPVLIIDGTGVFRVEMLSQSPAVFPELLQEPFTTLQQQYGFIQRRFDFGLLVSPKNTISRAPAPDQVYTPTMGQPGFQFGVPTQTSYFFPQYGSSPGDELTKERGFFPESAPTAPIKLWALNKNPATTLSIRVWHWYS